MAAGISKKVFIIIEALDKTGAAFRSVSARFDRMGSSLISAGKKLALGLTVAMTPVALSAKRFADFDDTMRRVQGRANVAASEMGGLRKQAKELGRTTSFTASQVGILQEKLAQKGFNIEEIEDATQSVLNLARAGGRGDSSDTETAAKVASAAILAFGLTAKDSTRVADVFTAAVNSSALTLEDLQHGLSKIGPLGVDFSSSLEEVTAWLGVLSNVGIEAAEGGTALRNMFLELSSDKVEDFREAFVETFGHDIDLTLSKTRKIPHVLKDIFKDLNKLSAVESSRMLSILFGKRVIVKAGALGKATEQLDVLLGKLNDSNGIAASTAETFDSGLGGAFRKVLSAIEGVGIALGESLSPELMNFSDIIIAIANDMATWIELNNESVVAMFNASMTVGKLAAALISLGIALKVLAVLLSPLGLAVGIVVLAFEGLYQLFGRSFIGDVSQGFNDILGIMYEWEKQTIRNTKALKDYADSAEIVRGIYSQTADLTKKEERDEAAKAAGVLTLRASILEDMLEESLHGTFSKAKSGKMYLRSGSYAADWLDVISERHGGQEQITIDAGTPNERLVDIDTYQNVEKIRRELNAAKSELRIIREEMDKTRDAAAEVADIAEKGFPLPPDPKRPSPRELAAAAAAAEKAFAEMDKANKGLLSTFEKAAKLAEKWADIFKEIKKAKINLTLEELEDLYFLGPELAQKFIDEIKAKQDVKDFRDEPIEVSQGLLRGSTEALTQFLESRRAQEKQLDVLIDIRNGIVDNPVVIGAGDNL